NLSTTTLSASHLNDSVTAPRIMQPYGGGNSGDGPIYLKAQLERVPGQSRVMLRLFLRPRNPRIGDTVPYEVPYIERTLELETFNAMFPDGEAYVGLTSSTSTEHTQ